MKNISIIFIFLVNACISFSWSIAYAGLDEVDLKWKARGLQAQEKLDKIEVKKKKSAADECTKDIEQAFFEHANPKRSIQFKKDINGNRIYNLTIFSPIDTKFVEKKEDKGALVMTVIYFMYDKSGALKETYIDMLAKGWSVLFLKGKEGFAIQDSKCAYVIYPDNPLSSKFLSANSNQ